MALNVGFDASISNIYDWKRIREKGKKENLPRRDQSQPRGNDDQVRCPSWSMVICLEKEEATGLEANPEEMPSEAVYREVPKEAAAVETGRAPEIAAYGT